MKSRQGKRVLLSGFASIGLIAAGIGLPGCGEELPPPPPKSAAEAAPVDARATKKKGKKTVDTTSRQERQKQRADQ